MANKIDPCFNHRETMMEKSHGTLYGIGLAPARLTGKGLLIAMGVALAALAPGYAISANGDLCKAASSVTVGQALHATVVRAEAPPSDNGCEYSIKGTPADATGNHANAMIGALGGTAMDPEAAKAISAFSRATLGEASAKEQQKARHPGEVTILAFTVSTGNALQEMKINRDMMARMSPVTTVPGLGDDAFETSGSVIMVRKGDKFIHFIYPQCNCSSKDLVPLAKLIVAAL